MTDPAAPDLEPLYTLDDVADALGMSGRWLRDKIKSDKLAHKKLGHKIKFDGAQYQAILKRYDVQSVEQSITTGRKKRAS